MASVNAIFYDGETPVAAFVGAWEQFIQNRDNEGLPWRVMNGTPWERVDGYRVAPPLSEFDAWVAENPAAGPPEPQA